MWLLLLACTTAPDTDAPAATESTPPTESAESESEPLESYTGPSYEPCVTEASCAPGDACTTVSGYDGTFCSPACDPDGDGSECAPEGTVDYDTTCMPDGRCARSCDGGCPEELACVEDDTGLAMPLCAGEPAGLAGYYGTCSHPNVDGPDCPDGSACYGGEYVNSDYGVCLPYCPDSTCPAVEHADVDASPICYDVGLEAPVCALLCFPDISTCPDDQTCYPLYSNLGICAPPDTYYED